MRVRTAGGQVTAAEGRHEATLKCRVGIWATTAAVVPDFKPATSSWGPASGVLLLPRQVTPKPNNVRP
jgi:hypothetical protein